MYPRKSGIADFEGRRSLPNLQCLGLQPAAAFHSYGKKIIFFLSSCGPALRT